MPKYVTITKAAKPDPTQASADLVVTTDTGNVLMSGTKPTIANASTFADLTAATTAYNNLLIALRTRGVIS